MPAPRRPASKSWWHHDGALAVVFTGLLAGDLVLPVRLPQGSAQWPHLAYFLADSNTWHKIDLVRVADRKAPGGWRYYAHLLAHQAGYQSPSTLAHRREIPAAGPEQLPINAGRCHPGRPPAMGTQRPFRPRARRTGRPAKPHHRHGRLGHSPRGTYPHIENLRADAPSTMDDACPRPSST